MDNQLYKLTQKQYDELVERKKIIEEEALPANSSEIEKAKDFGDLSENAEYHAAKEANSKLLSELNHIDAKLNRSTIITHSADTSIAEIGNFLKVHFKNDNTTFEFTLIGENGNGVDEIDIDSKLGKSIYKKKVGDKVSFESKDGSVGEIYLEIMDIS